MRPQVKRAVLACVLLAGCATSHVLRPDGTVLDCAAFGQSHAMACAPGSDRGSVSGAFVVGTCCDAHGGAISPQTDTMMTAILSAAVSAAVTIAAHGGF